MERDRMRDMSQPILVLSLVLGMTCSAAAQPRLYSTHSPWSGGERFVVELEANQNNHVLVQLSPTEVEFDINGQIYGFQNLNSVQVETLEIVGNNGKDYVEFHGTHPDFPIVRFFGGGESDEFYMHGQLSLSADGDAGNDILVGGPLRDFLTGGNGSDVLRGMAGDDQLFGDAGNDQIEGGDDNDYINGGTGLDDMDGGPGNDELDDSWRVTFASNPFDLPDGNNDTMRGGPGNDDFTGFQTFAYYPNAWGIWERLRNLDTIVDFSPNDDQIYYYWISESDLLLFTGPLALAIP